MTKPVTTKRREPTLVEWEELELNAIKYYGVTWDKRFAFMPTWTMDGWIWLRSYWYLPIVGCLYAAKKKKPYVMK